MTIKQFIKTLTEKNGITMKELGVKIGRGNSTSFWRTVTSGNTRADDLKKCIEATNEPFIIVYRGENVHIK